MPLGNLITLVRGRRPTGSGRPSLRLPELAKFGSVGALAYVVDLGVFNLFRVLVGTSPIIAKVISVAVATLVAWLGNRYWTFSTRRTATGGKEFIQFATINVFGLLIGVACLWVSHYLLGFTGVLADNISANIIGLGLGTLFRYFGYRRWVFTGKAG